MHSLVSPLVLGSLFAVTCAAPSANMTARAPRAISVASATELGAITQNGLVTGRDNGQSAYLNGKSYWFFDDTMLTNNFLSNTAAVTSDLNAADNIALQSADWTSTSNTGAPSLTIYPTQAETDFQTKHSAATSGCTGASDAFCNMQYAHWPGAVLADPDRSRVLVGYGKLCRASEGSKCTNGGLAGTPLGWGWYEANVYYGLGQRLLPSTGGLTDASGVPDPALFGGPSSTSFTTGAVAYNGYAYLYGGGDLFTGSSLAKVPLSDFTNIAAWTYWNGNAYVSSSSTLKGTIAVGAAGNTVFYSAALGGFYNVYMPFGSSTAYMQSAPAPEGPWSSPVQLFTSATAGGQTNYACFAHPEYASADGRTQYISYYQTGSGAQRLVKVVLN